MAKTLNPVDFARTMPTDVRKWAQSVHSVMNGAVDMGVPQSKDATGNFNEFQQGNSSGILIRVGATGTSGNKYAWTASNTPITINHGLIDTNGKPRQPIGVHLVNSDKALNIYQPTTPDTMNVYVAPSDATANATIYVF